MALQLPPPPPPVVQALSGELPPGLRARLDALQKAQDWPGLADLAESLPPAQRGLILETWLRALAKAGRHARLLEVCKAAIPQLDGPRGPRLSTARIFHAQALSALGRSAEAREAHLENGVLGFPTGFANACAEARNAQDWPALMACAQAWEKAHPEAPEPAAWQGEALAKQGRWGEAEPLLLATTQKLSQRPMAWADLSACRFQRGAFQEAWEAASQALALEPKLLEALYNRGRAAYALQRYAEGREDFRAALELAPAPELAEQLRSSIAAADRFLAGRARKAAPVRRGAAR